MKIVQLGKSGLKVSQVCLGTMTFGREAGEAASFAIMDYFVEQGGTFLDTADAYSIGATESVVGRWLKARGNRDNLVLATKVFHPMGSGPNDGGLSRQVSSGCRLTSSTSTRFTVGIRRCRSRKPSAPWMIWSARGRFAMSGAPTCAPTSCSTALTTPEPMP